MTNERKKIILIGGTSGVGKTTLGRDLLCNLQLSHHEGTGFIREAVRAVVSQEENPFLFEYSFHEDNARDLIDHFRKQAQFLSRSILSCLSRARREGTSLIVEGTHILPQIYYKEEVSLLLILEAPKQEEHFARLNGDTHNKRIVTDQDFQNIRRIDKFLKDEAKKYGIPTIVYDFNLPQILQLIK